MSLVLRIMKKKWSVLVVLLALIMGIVLLYVFGPVAGTMPLWMSILPPLVAIVMALLIKEVISSLFVGILTGTFLMALYGGASPASALGGGLLRVVDTYVVGSPMAEVLKDVLPQIEASNVLNDLNLEPQKYILLSFCFWVKIESWIRLLRIQEVYRFIL